MPGLITLIVIALGILGSLLYARLKGRHIDYGETVKYLFIAALIYWGITLLIAALAEISASALGIFIGLMAVAYLISDWQKSHHANRANIISSYLAYGLINGTLASIAFAIAGTPGAIIYVVCISTIYLQAQLFQYLGRPRLAFFFARWSLFEHVRDPLGAAYLFQWRAIKQLPPEHRARALENLKEDMEKRFSKAPGKIRTASLLMACFIQHPQKSNMQISQRLSLYGASAGKRIPRGVANYCFKFCLASELSALPQAEWNNKINEIAGLWHALGANWAAGWFLARSACMDKHANLRQRWIYHLNLGKPHWARYLTANAPNSRSYAIEQRETSDHACKPSLELLYQTQWKDDQLGSLLHQAQQPDFYQYWHQRAEQLGCFNPDDAVAAVQNSVKEFCGMHSQTFANDSNSGYLRIEHLQQQLDIMLNAIERDSEKNTKPNPFTELERWLALLTVILELDRLDADNRVAIYYKIEYVVWDWLAELWDNKQRSLAYFICNIYRNLAIEAGNAERVKYCNQLLNGEFS